MDAYLISQTIEETRWGQQFIMDGGNAAAASSSTPRSHAAWHDPTTSPNNSNHRRQHHSYHRNNMGNGVVNSSSNNSNHTGTINTNGNHHHRYQQLRDHDHHNNHLDNSGRQGSQTTPIHETRWERWNSGWAHMLMGGSSGLQVLREERPTPFSAPSTSTDDTPHVPELKASIVVKATPLQAFVCLHSLSKMQDDRQHEQMIPNSGQHSSFRIVERLDDYMDVIHLVSRPLYLWPSWTTPRDFVLLRHWHRQKRMACTFSL